MEYTAWRHYGAAVHESELLVLYISGVLGRVGDSLARLASLMARPRPPGLLVSVAQEHHCTEDI